MGTAYAQMDALERGYRVDAYHLKFDVQEEERRLDGVATLSIVKVDPKLQQLVLDAEGLEISKVQLGDQLLRYQLKPRTIVIKLPRGHKEERFKVTVRYSAPESDAVNFTGPTKDEPDAPRTLFTISEPDLARKWFPCDDHPSRASSVDLQVTVPKEFLALSNGQFNDSKPAKAKSGGRTFRFHQDRLAPTFVSLVAGEFEVHRMAHRGIDLTFLYPPSLRDKARDFFGNTTKAMDILSSFFGTDYPFKSYAASVVPDFPAAALENTAATTFDLDIVRTRQKNVGVHELAHHWFGDHLRLKSWNDLWIMEGMATYAEAIFAREVYGKDNFNGIMNEFLSTYVNDGHRDDPRKLVDVNNRNSDRLFDAHSYEKGAWVYRMLEARLGKETFREALHRFVADFGDREVGTANLQKVFEEVSQQDLTLFFNQWVYGSGYPAISWDWKWDSRENCVKIDLRQKQNGNGGIRKFVFPIEVAFEKADGKWIRETFQVSGRTETLRSLSLTEKPARVLLDPDLSLLATYYNYDHWTTPRLIGLATQRYDWLMQEEALKQLAKNVASSSQTQVLPIFQKVYRDPSNYVGARAAAIEFMKSFPISRVLPDLLHALQSPHEPIRSAALTALSSHRTPKAFEPILRLFTHEPTAEAAWALASSDPEKAENLFQSWIDDPKRSTSERGYAVYGLARVKSPAAIERLRSMLKSDSQSFRWLASEGIAEGKVSGLEDDLRAHIDSKSENLAFVREWSLRALQKLKDYDSVDRIALVAKNDPTFNIRNAARRALTKLQRTYEEEPKSVKRTFSDFPEKAELAIAESVDRENKREIAPFTSNASKRFRADMERYGSWRTYQPPQYAEVMKEGIRDGVSNFPASAGMFAGQKFLSDVVVVGSEAIWEAYRDWKSFEDLRRAFAQRGVPWLKEEAKVSTLDAVEMGVAGGMGETVMKGLAPTSMLTQRVGALWIALALVDVRRKGHVTMQTTLLGVPNVLLAHYAAEKSVLGVRDAIRAIRAARAARQGIEALRIGVRSMETESLASMNWQTMLATGVVEFTLLHGMSVLEHRWFEPMEQTALREDVVKKYIAFQRVSFSDRVLEPQKYGTKREEWGASFEAFVGSLKAYMYHTYEEARSEYERETVRLEKRARGGWWIGPLSATERAAETYRIETAYVNKLNAMEKKLTEHQRRAKEMPVPLPEGQDGQKYEASVAATFEEYLAPHPQYFIDQTRQLVDANLKVMDEKWDER